MLPSSGYSPAPSHSNDELSPFLSAGSPFPSRPSSPATATPASAHRQRTFVLRKTLYKNRYLVACALFIPLLWFWPTPQKAATATHAVKAKLDAWDKWNWAKGSGASPGEQTGTALPARPSRVVDPALVAEYLPDDDEDAEIDYGAEIISIKALPIPRRPRENDEGIRYLGFLPHSGFHNQRMALQNALLLGSILNRTVLIPPVWIGWPTPSLFYDELHHLTQLSANIVDEPSPNVAALVRDGPPSPSSPLNAPALYPSSSSDYPIFNGTALAAERAALVAAALAISNAKWAAKGFDVRPDGFPISNLTAKECKSYSPECRHTYRDTVLAWDFLVDLGKVRSEVDVVDRWDVRERAVEGLLGVRPEEIYVLRDGQSYDFQFVHSGKANSPLIVPSTTNSHWARRVQLPALAAHPSKVLLVGSLFGSGRIHVPEAGSASDAPQRSFFSRAMAFRNPWLLAPADAIRDRLGGTKGYVGVHARVGDGQFMWRARENMERAWRTVISRLDVQQEDVDAMWAKVGVPVPEDKEGEGWRRGRRAQVEERSEWTKLDDGWNSDDQDVHDHVKRADDLKHPLPPLVNLTCRSQLHTDPALLAFNTPIYLATDSHTPTTDPVLAPFFAAFPCTFILSDFDRPSVLNGGEVVESVGAMLRLVNKLDGIPLGRLLLPFLEATVAAKGYTTIGTYASTFSSFAAGDLHKAYLEDIGELAE